MKLILGAAIAVAFVPTADATCAYIQQVDQLISASGVIPTDGAVLVGHGPVAPTQAGKKPHAPKAEDWKLVDGTGKPADVKLVEIAPGIRAFVRATPATPKTKLVIKDVGGELGTFTYDTIKLDLPAPSGSNARVTFGQGFRGINEAFSIDVASVPDDAAYLVVTGSIGSKSAVGAPHSQQGKQTLIPYASGGHCDSGSPGSAPNDGEMLTLTWMDRFGRKGVASKPVKATLKR